MNLLKISLLAIGLLSLAPPPSAEAYTREERIAIRATPMLKRPMRPGHFYGNTVRRVSRMAGR